MNYRELGKPGVKVPWIHQTDLFRPHADPDDHWDLACVFALAAAQCANLRGIVIDYPPPNPFNFNPDLDAVAQMNYLHALAVPVVVGSSIPVQSLSDSQASAPGHERAAVNFILDTLRESPQPVFLHLVGSCRDYALAVNTDPDLFRQKCAGIYLNAGQAHPHPAGIEYNVRLNPAAYAALFRAPCPIFWMPCFGSSIRKEDRRVEEFGTWYDFLQGDILPHLPTRLQHYFASALGRVMSTHWLQFLEDGGPAKVLEQQNAQRRNMWCTAGFFHAAGLTVTTAGEIVGREPAPQNAVFEFIPVNLACTPEGEVTWTPGNAQSKDRLFRVRDRTAYPAAMTTAMKALLSNPSVYLPSTNP